jgi:hypothetical protein
MPLTVYFLAFIGLAGILGGIFALRANRKFALSGLAPKRWRIYHVMAIVLGMLCGIASWLLTGAMGYPFETPEGIGRIVGIPFIVAFFDSRGRDYISSFMMLSIIANASFWSLFPQLLLLPWGYLWRMKRESCDPR